MTYVLVSRLHNRISIAASGVDRPVLVCRRNFVNKIIHVIHKITKIKRRQKNGAKDKQMNR